MGSYFGGKRFHKYVLLCSFCSSNVSFPSIGWKTMLYKVRQAWASPLGSFLLSFLRAFRPLKAVRCIVWAEGSSRPASEDWQTAAGKGTQWNTPQVSACSQLGQVVTGSWGGEAGGSLCSCFCLMLAGNWVFPPPKKDQPFLDLNFVKLQHRGRVLLVVNQCKEPKKKKHRKRPTLLSLSIWREKVLVTIQECVWVLSERDKECILDKS